MKLYPLQFHPIFKERIWGGTKLRDFLNKAITSPITGESWEISTVENEVSVVANGSLKGQTLNELLNLFPEEILGAKVYPQFGKQFPLLFKFIDAKEDLSIQLHPNDTLAKERHDSFGKTEMWYVMQADEGAKLIIGFREDSSSEEYLKHLQDKALVDILDVKTVKPGDVFYLETGTIHAIGAGVLIAEIQQTSDITYRVYDFDRTDSHGNARELHVDLALEAINYKKVKAEVDYSRKANVSNELVSCQYFTTHFISLEGSVQVKKDKQSFTVYMCTEGDFDLIYKDENFHFKMGDTILIPAEMNEYEIIGKASLLEIYI